MSQEASTAGHPCCSAAHVPPSMGRVQVSMHSHSGSSDSRARPVTATIGEAFVTVRPERRRWWVGGTGSLARSSGSHCGGHTPGLASARLLATLGFAMCGRKAVQEAAATPMRMIARKLEAYFFASGIFSLDDSSCWGDLEGLGQR